MLMQNLKKKKKNVDSENEKKSKFLITITVLGSAGPIRFVVKEEDLVAGVIVTALKSYARVGRLPALGFDANKFLLYCTSTGSDALNPWECIGSGGGRNFVMCKKQVHPMMSEGRQEIMDRKGRHEILDRKGSGSWKAWLNKSLSFKISSH